MWQLAASLWHQLSADEQAVWESLGTRRHMTGYAWYMSQALRPNPGIYLPLAGGTMTGDIDMDGHQVTAMLDPAADQDGATKKYHDDNLPAGPYIEGARVYHSADQDSPNLGDYTVLFDSEHYDNDAIHNPANPERLTCKTPGTYLISATICFDASVVGARSLVFRVDPGNVRIQTHSTGLRADGHYRVSMTSVWPLILNDYVTLVTWQNSGGILAIKRYANYSPEFMIQRIG